MSKYPIKDKVVLITGASRGIGLALVEAFLESESAKVYAAVRTLETAQPLVDKYKDRVVPLYMDLNKAESITAAAGIATDVDIVINNAGILSYTTPTASDAVAQLQHEMEVNVYGFIHVAQAFAPLLKEGGILCQINSVGSLRCPIPSVSTYAASKAAAFTMTQALRTSLKEQGTFVMSVHPGPVATDMISQRGDLKRADIASADSVAKEVVKSMQAGEFLCFPDELSKSLSKAYQPFADYVFEQGNVY
ncbi:3alpha-hydroxy bile acid-CoA-ester 3-dehydrogenase [Seminavis robusta]|uniref:3alpha-hydroxy bile acid-CoA-ester 3-dehydrogenase n=1 Tax=Seminavis robusta TaxID=568900 RepID=A0A9N8DTF4_9STRA|nr:3alpha-hydroxy bile acid-CoA-ester 3-dehydrogenase [Seminavis robusta]|eukprot:Sro275_g105850.1 3alpha-hydroxy bile acid-CoA-ester 3-dehydrogenase (249) ;mRNA; f:69660-70406